MATYDADDFVVFDRVRVVRSTATAPELAGDASAASPAVGHPTSRTTVRGRWRNALARACAWMFARRTVPHGDDRVESRAKFWAEFREGRRQADARADLTR
jgi:hypothetical protein